MVTELERLDSGRVPQRALGGGVQARASLSAGLLSAGSLSAGSLSAGSLSAGLLSAGLLSAGLLLAGCHKLLGLTGAPEQGIGSSLPDAGGGSAGAAGGPLDAGHDPGLRSPLEEAPSAVPLSPACIEYCGVVGNACTGSVQQYLSDTDCISFCTVLESLSAGALVCRTSRVQDFPENVCPAAGPTGSMIAGPSCEDEPCGLYCGLMREVCDTTRLGAPNSSAPTAADDDLCQNICAGLAQSEDYDVIPPPTGANLNCRIHHINLALRSPPGSDLRLVHCRHAAGQPGVDGETFIPCPDE